jgi:hypothetical protein
VPSDKPARVYVDTSVFLNVAYREPLLWPDSLKVLKAFDRGNITMVASTMLHAELAGWTGKVDDNEAHQADLRAYLDGPDLQVIEVDTLLIRDARVLARRHQLHGCGARGGAGGRTAGRRGSSPGRCDGACRRHPDAGPGTSSARRGLVGLRRYGGC